MCTECVGKDDQCIPNYIFPIDGVYGAVGACVSDTYVFGYTFDGISSVYITGLDSIGMVDGYYDLDTLFSTINDVAHNDLDFECFSD